MTKRRSKFTETCNEKEMIPMIPEKRNKLRKIHTKRKNSLWSGETCKKIDNENESEPEQEKLKDSTNYNNNETKSPDLEENEKISSEENLTNEIDEQKQKKGKKGLIYVSNLPKHMNVTLIKEYLGQYGNIGRIYLQPDKTTMFRSKKRKNMARHFSEGWIEFLSKKIAKGVAIKLNNTQIGTRKKSKFYDSLWCIKYLPGFKWVHLSERLAYEQAVYKKRLMVEISQARKEADFFQQNLDKSEILKKMDKRNKKKKSEI